MKQTLTFDDQCINQNKFHIYKENVSDFFGIDIKKTLFSSKYAYGNEGYHKYYIGYMYGDNLSPLPLCLTLPKMDAYSKYFGSGNTNATVFS